jgi:hypothetical protein
MQVLPTLAPLRDPLICLIRAWHREPALYPYSAIFNAWVLAAKRWPTLRINYWRMEPFDKDGFLNALKACGLSENAEWEGALQPGVRVNDTPGECDLRGWYAAGDKSKIAKKLPICWRQLREYEPLLRPFLEAYGFRDLLWWS